MDDELGDNEHLEANALDKAYNWQNKQVRPVYEIDPVDLALNWEIYPCNLCGGSGEQHYFTPDGDEGWCECDCCGECGDLAVRKM